MWCLMHTASYYKQVCVQILSKSLTAIEIWTAAQLVMLELKENPSIIWCSSGKRTTNESKRTQFYCVKCYIKHGRRRYIELVPSERYLKILLAPTTVITGFCHSELCLMTFARGFSFFLFLEGSSHNKWGYTHNENLRFVISKSCSKYNMQ